MPALLTRRRAIAAAAAACLGLPLSASAQTIAGIRKKGALSVGLLVDFPPFGLLDAANRPDGYDADVARLLAAELGVKLELLPVTGPNRIPYLLSHKVDLLVASFSPTPERARQVQFARPHSAATIVVYGPRKLDIKAAADLKGLRVAVARASTQDSALSAVAPPGAEIRRFDDDASAMQALLSGQVDALGCATNVSAAISQRSGERYENKFVLRQQFMAIAMRLGQGELLAAVNAFVGRNVDNGALQQLYRKWLQSDLPQLPDSSLPAA